MGKLFDRIFIGLLALGTLGHLVGTFKRAELGSDLFAWSMSGVLASGLLVALNILRHRREKDKAVAAISLVGGICWIGVVMLFGQSVGNLADPRVLMHALTTLVLCGFSLQRVLR